MTRQQYNLDIISFIETITLSRPDFKIGEIIWYFTVPKDTYDLFFPESSESWNHFKKQFKELNILGTGDDETETVLKWTIEMKKLVNRFPQERWGQLVCNYCLPKVQGNLIEMNSLEDLCKKTESKEWLLEITSNPYI